MLPFCTRKKSVPSRLKAEDFKKNNNNYAPMRKIGEGGYYG